MIINLEIVIPNRQARFGPHDDGGWDICMDLPYAFSESCLIYSFGIDNDFSFEEAVEKRFNCEIHSFDPRYTKNFWIS